MNKANTSNHRVSNSLELRAAWQQGLGECAEAQAQASQTLYGRFVAQYQQLTALSRKARRQLQRQLSGNNKRTLAGIAMMAAMGSPALAATITVDQPDVNAETGCNLVDAITAANTDTATGDCVAGSGADTIELPTSSTITLTEVHTSGYYGYIGSTGLPIVASEITINGNGSTIARSSEEGTPAFRILSVGNFEEPAALTLNDSTISGGLSDDAAEGLGAGGGIAVVFSSLTLNNSTVTGNTSTGAGGGIGAGYSQLTLNNSTVSGNTAGGAAYGYGYGGGVASFGGAVAIINSTITGNTAEQSGGVHHNEQDYGGLFSITQSVVSGNTATEEGAASEVALYADYGEATAASENNVFGHSGLTNAEAVQGFAPSMSDVTATSDGTAPTALPSILDTTLAHNGGFTQTHNLVAGSPAVDGVPAATCANTGDQRGLDRPQGADCDIGAIEFTADPIDDTSFEFSPNSYTLAEEDGAAVLTVRRNGINSAPVSVNFITSNASALAGDDFVAGSGTLNWALGDLAPKTLSVDLIDDDASENTERFLVRLNTPVGGELGRRKVGEVQITDTDILGGNDLLQFKRPEIYDVNEGDGTINLVVERVGTGIGEASIDFRTARAAATSNLRVALSGIDYTPVPSGTLTWADGDMADKTVSVTLIDDTQAEQRESFQFILSNPQGAKRGRTFRGVVQVSDNDPDALQFNPVRYTVDEDTGSGQVELTVTRIGDGIGAPSINYATGNASARAGQDYVATSGTVSFAENDFAPKTFTVDLINDAGSENTEEFLVRLSGAVDGQRGATHTATVRITDGDTAGGNDTLQLQRPNELTFSEAVGTVDYVFTRSGTGVGAASVDYALQSQSATFGADFDNAATPGTATGTINWADGDVAAKTLTVSINDDLITEDQEQFRLVLSNATGGVLGAVRVGLGRINDNDAP